ncbi:MAG: PfkB family carbohydrate kinase [Candidatus Nanopelagicales bacterium]
MITVMGEALIDVIVDVDGDVTAAAIGGAPLNTARTLARLDVPVSFLGGVSADAFGRRIMRMLQADGVGYALKEPMSAPTTLAIAELDDHGAASYRFVFDGTSATLVSPADAIAAVRSDCTVLHVGTLALVLEPLAMATRAVVEAAPASQIVMVDPNLRPAVMTGSIVFQETLAAVLERADVVKVSGDDLAFLYPGERPATAAEQIHMRTGATVLFTDGANAVEVICAGGKQVLPVPAVPVVDTVGAGDSFSGGFLAHWVRQGWGREELQELDKVVEAAEFGIKVAGITCQRAGAEPPFSAEVAS